MPKQPPKKIDWKPIAEQLGQRVLFAVTHCKPNGSGLMLDIETGGMRSWLEYMADGLELIPGIKVDREMIHLQQLPYARRKKAITALNKKRAGSAKS